MESNNFSTAPFSDSDRYEIRELIGEGGMGRVFRAFDPLLSRDVAIKVLNFDGAAESVRERFLREAKALGVLEHQNIVRIFGSGINAQGNPYHVMEYLEGSSLAAELKAGALSASSFFTLFSDVLNGIQHAHENKIVHRDLKPSNIFHVHDIDGNNIFKVIDFGIARIDNDNESSAAALTRTNAVLGSPVYMSPEQCRGQRADALSDIYSLGCIMFECITGAPPFAAEGGLEIMYKHLNEAAPPIKAQAKAPESRRLAALVARCLEKDAARRYQSVAELKAEFNEVFAGDRSKIDLFTVKEKSKLSGASLAIMPIIFLCLAIPAAFFMFKNFGFSGTKSSDSVLVSDQDKVKRHIDLFKAKSFNDVNDYFGLGRNQLLSKSPLDVADAEKTYTDAIAKCQGKGSNHDRLSASYAMRAKTRWMLHKYKESLEDYDEAINIASKVEPDVEVLRDIYIEQTILFLGSRKLPEAYSAFYAASKNGFEKIPELSFSQQMEAADVVLNQHLDRMGDNRIGMLEQITTLMKQTQPRNKDEALQLLMLANQIAIVSHAIALSVGSDRAGTGPVLDYAVKILPMVQGHEDIKEQARALYKKLR